MNHTPTNPFFNRHRITDPAYFCGRKSHVEQLYSAIVTRQSRSIVGERKLGKSSLLTYVMQAAVMQDYDLDPAQFLFIYLDLEGMTSATRPEFWLEIVEQCYDQTSDTRLRQRFDRYLYGDDEMRFSTVRRLLRRVRDAGTQVVCALDEFECLAENEQFGPEFYGELRSLASEMGVVYLTASKHSLYDLTYHNSSSLSSPFFNIFSELPLGLMGDDEGHELMRHLSTLGGRTLPAEAIAYALDLAGPHPFFLQIAGSCLMQGSSPLDEAARQAAHDCFMAEVKDHFHYLWSRLSELEQGALVSKDTAPANVIKRLLERGLLYESDGVIGLFSQGFAKFVQGQALGLSSRAAQEPPTDSDISGRTLGPYQVLELVGRGGMAVVYRGYQPMIDRYVALKLVRPHFATDQEFMVRFQREATAIAKLRHSNVVQVYDFGVQGERYYMVLEFIDGPTLKQVLHQARAEGRCLPLSQVISVVNDVAAALDYAHSIGIVHRDVKPANIMLMPDGQAVLTDFGMAKILSGGEYTASGSTLGTPEYMSPEQGLGEEVTACSDVYSLGVVVYEMLLGQRPFESDSPMAVVLQHIQNQVPEPHTLDPHVSPAIETVVLKSLHKDPAKRYTTAGELAQALRQATKEGA
jgi:tRNA A-37 threonylcarbamoyl transferase component Bud32